MKKILLVLFLVNSILIAQLQWLPGDITSDDTIDVLDIILGVNIILDVEVPDPDSRELWAADINWDGTIDILDIIAIVNVIIQPAYCGDAQVCEDSPFECCTNLHSSAFMDCGMCHMNNYNNTDSPDHSSQEFPTEYCSTCHNPFEGWYNPLWEHRYLDIGCINCHQPVAVHMMNFGHSDSNCLSCHNNVDILYPPACSDCHIDSYYSATSPDHVELNFSTDCASCHSTDYWGSADIHQQPLADCSDCHSFDGLNAPLPEIDHTTAVKLGEDIYDCLNCHNSTDNWLDITFSSNGHDGSQYQIYFDIYSGEHNNDWSNTCSGNCHVFGAFNTFSCYEGCHANDHGQNSANGEHCEDYAPSINNLLTRDCADCYGSNGYWNIGYIEYETGNWNDPETFVQCYTCHPDGDKDGPCGDD